nr:hypothetical protein [Deltaproteobacteria bacterium]
MSAGDEKMMDVVIGRMPPREVAARLRAMGDVKGADAIEDALATQGTSEKAFSLFLPKPWGYREHKYGYIGPGGGAIAPAGGVTADAALTGAQLDVSLNRLFLQEYPGFGEHTVLVTFKESAAQPAIKPLSEITLGLASMLAGRSDNAKVQEFSLGLDFDASGSPGVRLREGNYVAMQVQDDYAINWSDWVFDANHDAIVGVSDPDLRPGCNYLVFRVSRAPTV